MDPELDAVVPPVEWSANDEGFAESVVYSRCARFLSHLKLTAAARSGIPDAENTTETRSSRAVVERLKASDSRSHWEVLAHTEDTFNERALVLATDRYSVVLCDLGSHSHNYWVWAADEDAARELSDRLAQKTPLKKAAEGADQCSVNFRFSSQNGSTADTRDLTCPTLASLAGNYSTKVTAGLEHLASLEKPEEHGKVVLWHGPPGTGKSHAVRAVMLDWAKRLKAEVEVVLDPEVMFASTDYMHSVLLSERRYSRKRSAAPLRLVVLEDSGEFFTAGCRDRAGFGRFLNLTDGILGQGQRLVFLLTTNEHVDKIDLALTRPGRCLQVLEFPLLSEAEQFVWFESRNAQEAAGVARGPRALADLYATLRGEPQVQAPVAQLGFGR